MNKYGDCQWFPYDAADPYLRVEQYLAAHWYAYEGCRWVPSPEQGLEMAEAA
jgi:hypothetical protein